VKNFISHIATLLIALSGVLFSAESVALHTSVTCTPRSATVASAGAVVINISTCDPYFVSIPGLGFGTGTPSYTGVNRAVGVLPANGSALLSMTGASSFLTYTHNGNAATSDFFEIEDADNLYVRINITISPPTSSIVVSPASVSLRAGLAFSQQLSATSGSAPYTYSISAGALPPGLSMTPQGLITGTPTIRSAFNFSVRAQDSTSAFTVKTYSGSIASPIFVATPSPLTLLQGVAASMQLNGGGGTAPYTFPADVGVVLPSGLSLSTSGLLTGTPTTLGTINANILVNDSTTDPACPGCDFFAFVTLPMTVTATLPTVSIAVTPGSVPEDGAANLVFTVTRSVALASATTVNITTSGTATSGSDYTGGVATVVIPAGATTATITINPTADTTVEADETVILTVAAGAGYTVGAPSSATGTILNDDQPTLTINDVTVSEGNAGTTNFTFTVSLSAPAGPGGVSFDIATANGTATAGVDYVAQSLTGQTIPAGSSTYTFTVQVNGDTLNEPSETFFVNVTNVTGATVGDGQGLGTITNDDALPSISTSNITVTEGNSGTTNAVVTVTLSAASGQTVTVNYATADGSALAPGDYTTASGMLTFTPGQTSRTITVLVNGDVTPEANETFSVGLFGATNATINVATSFVTITNDDVPVSVSPPTLTNGNVAASYSQTITASGGIAPYTFTVTAGALPAGVTLTSGGILSGTPSASGTYNFTVTASDNSGAPGPYTGSIAYTIVIAQGSQTTLIASSTASTLLFGGSATLSITGGSGAGVVTYASNNANCTIVGTTLTAAAVGTCTVTATKAADTNYTAATSAGITVTINQATQAALVAASTPSTVAFGNATALSTTGGSGTGAVTFASSNANCTIVGTTLSAAAVGTCTITATKAADTNYTAATSAGITVTVNQATQAILIAASTPSTVAFGGTTTLSTTGGSGTGAVTFASNNANCTIVGSTLTAAAVGTCTVTATKLADTNYATASSTGITVTVNQATQTALVVTGAPSTVVFGGTTTLSSTGGSGTGAVTFASNNANCTIVGSTLTAAGAGTCTVTATKAADANYTAATSAGITVTINQATQAALVAASAPSTVAFGGTTTLSTTGGSGTGAVTFASSNANCTISGTTLTAAAIGTCTITATKAADANYTAATSVGITVTVNQAAQATLVAVSTPSTITFGGTTTLSTTGGSGTGAVTFASNNANCNIVGSTLTAAAVGTCTVTATKSADTNYTAATSIGITVTVNQATQATLVVASTPSIVAFGGTTTLSTTGGSGTGTVTFASNNANCTIVGSILTAAAVGTCTVTATKAADTNYTAATSAGTSVTVNQAAQTITFAPSFPASVIATAAPFTISATASSGLVVSFSTLTATICTSGGPNGSQITLTGTSGICTIRALQAGNANYLAATATDRSINVSPPQTSTTASLTSSATNPVAFGSAFNLIAQINGNRITGNVDFSVVTANGNSIICASVAISASGGASCQVPLNARRSGNIVYIVNYPGDANNTATSAILNQVISLGTVELSVSNSPVKPIAGRPITLSALVVGAEPSGVISFIVGQDFVIDCFAVPLSVLPGQLNDPTAAVANCVLPSLTAGKHQLIVAYPQNSNNQAAQRSLTIEVEARGPTIDYSDMWWSGQQENGWGLAITQKGSVQFNAFYVYDNAGKPIWYVMPGGEWNTTGTPFTRYTGLLYQPTSSPFSQYDDSQFKPGQSIGSATINFTDANNAVFSYTINGVAAQKQIQRQSLGTVDNQVRLNVRDMWWAGPDQLRLKSENGWGVTIAQQERQLFGVWFTYDADGKTTWFVMPGGTWAGTTFTGDLFSTTSSPWLGTVYNPAALAVSKVGSVTFTFLSADAAMMTYTVNGLTQTKRITRQPF
jgi:hypothetical protein